MTASPDVQNNLEELDELGYTVLQDPVAHTLNDRVREAIVRLAQETEGGAKGHSAGLLLGREVFLGTTTATSGGTDGKLLMKTYETVHGPGFSSRRREDQAADGG